MIRFKLIRMLILGLFLSTSPVQAQTDSHTQLLVPAHPDSTSLQMIGVLSASYLYQSYLNIGYLADLNAVKAYKYEKLDENLQTVIQIVGGVRDQLKLYSLLLTVEADSQYVSALVRTADLLLQEAYALRKYMQSGTDKDAAIYLGYNKQVRMIVEKLLGLPED